MWTFVVFLFGYLHHCHQPLPNMDLYGPMRSYMFSIFLAFSAIISDLFPIRSSHPTWTFTGRNECIVLPDVTQLEPHQDPRTGDTDKYFLGDRFHEKTVGVQFIRSSYCIFWFTFQYPHSSELCRYHDINLCKELSAAKTSSQEVLNSTRNWRRLRY